MKILLLFCIILITAVAPSIVKAEKVLRVGAFHHPPMIFLDQDSVVQGYYVDILKEIASREGWKLNFIYGSWADGLERIKSGKLDLITSAAYSHERDHFLDYSKVSSFTVWSVLFAGRDHEIKDILSVNNKTIGIMKNDANGKNFIEMCNNFGIKCTFVYFQSFPEIFQAINDEKIEGGIAPNTAGHYLEHKFKVVRTSILINPFNIYFATGEGANSDVLETIDKYLTKWEFSEDSPIAKSTDKWLYKNKSPEISLWIYYSLAGIIGLFLISFVIALTFRRQVKKATNSLIIANKKLENEISEKESSQLALSVAFAEIKNAYEVKDIILNNLAHELRTPLNGILGFSKVLLQESCEGEAKEMMRMIHLSGQRLNKTLDSVYTLAKIESGKANKKIEEIDLKSLIEDVCRSLNEKIMSKDLKIDIDFCVEDVFVHSDYNYLNELIYQILDNAIKFTDFGSIKIVLSNSHLNNFTPIIKIIDTGIGISEDKIATLFEPFRQGSEGTNRTHEGMGIGLSISKGIAKLLDCSLEINSSINTGTTVSISFNN